MPLKVRKQDSSQDNFTSILKDQSEMKEHCESKDIKETHDSIKQNLT